jgi:hypothetical protein
LTAHELAGSFLFILWDAVSGLMKGKPEEKRGKSPSGTHSLLFHLTCLIEKTKYGLKRFKAADMLDEQV